MGALSRNKGASGEREVARLFRDWLGYDVKRNWQGQAAEGGSDLTGVPGYAVEVKRAKQYLSAWWEQAVEQATDGNKPALIYRIDGFGRGKPEADKWIVEIRACDALDCDISDLYRISMPLPCFMDFLRESA